MSDCFCGRRDRLTAGRMLMWSRAFKLTAAFCVAIVCLSGPAPLALGPAQAAKGNAAPNAATTRQAIIQILNTKDRLPLPIQKVRKTLTKHYVDNNGEIFWV